MAKKLSKFGVAFQNARNKGQSTFVYNGVTYGTRLRNESDSNWKKYLATHNSSINSNPSSARIYNSNNWTQGTIKDGSINPGRGVGNANNLIGGGNPTVPVYKFEGKNANLGEVIKSPERINFLNLDLKNTDGETRQQWFNTISNILDPDWQKEHNAKLYTDYGTDKQKELNFTWDKNQQFENLGDTNPGTKTYTSLKDFYNDNAQGINDYYNRFAGQKWDTSTEEGRKTWTKMQEYYDKNWKKLEKYRKKQNWGEGSTEALQYLYDMSHGTQTKTARNGSKLIPKHQQKSPVYQRFKSKNYTTGVNVVDKMQGNEQKQTVRNKFRAAQKLTPSQKRSREEYNIKSKQIELANAGYYKGKIDGKWGKLSKAAQAEYEKAGKKPKNTYNPNLAYVEVTDQNGKVLKSYHEELTPKRKQEIEKADELRRKREFQIPEEDREAFARYLYQQGQGNPITNALSSGLTFVKNVLGIGDNAIPASEGMKQQAIALHLLDTDNIYNNDGSRYHSLGYIPGTKDYKWHQIDGLQDVDAPIGLAEKLMYHPAEFTYGQYRIKETPEKYTVDDTYNFNQDGTDASKQKVASGNASTYQKIRYYAGEYGANKDQKVNVDIPKEDVYDWYQKFKNQNG